MTHTTIARPLLALVCGIGAAACGSASPDSVGAPSPSPRTIGGGTSDTALDEPEVEPIDAAPAQPDGDGDGDEDEDGDGVGDVTTPGSSTDAPVADACAALDDVYLDETLAGVESTFGGPLDFQPSIQESPSAFCSWTDATSGLSLQLTLEPAAAADVDDHGERAYNIDVEPVVEPQDGPGTKAVLLLDDAFADLGGDPFAYGYFFVLDDVTAFIETVGLEIGADNLRVLADEVAAHIG